MAIWVLLIVVLAGSVVARVGRHAAAKLAVVLGEGIGADSFGLVALLAPLEEAHETHDEDCLAKAAGGVVEL